MIIDFNLKETTAEIIQLEVKSNGKEKVLVNVNLKLGEIEFDRSHTFDHLKSKRRCSFRSVGEASCRIHMFIDSASVELFTDDYMTCMTNMVYVPEDADKIRICGIGGEVRIQKIRTWRIRK